MLRRRPRVTSHLKTTVAANGYLTLAPDTAPPDAQLVHTGPVRRELRELARSPDASHRTHPERPVLTGLMCREGRQTAHTPDTEHRALSGASGALCCTRQHTGRSRPASGASAQSVWCTPVTSPKNSHRRNRKYALNFLKSAESRLASSVGGREKPTPLSTLGTPPPLQMCQHQVYTTMCKCVSFS